MKRLPYLLRVCMVLLSAFTAMTADGAEKNTEGKKADANTVPVSKVTGTPVVTFLNINSISTPLRSNGIADINVQQNNSGLIFPKGSGKSPIYESGFLWGAKVSGDPQPRVGGSSYSSGLQPGKILSPGVAEDPNLPKNRIYRVRPDYRSGDLTSEIADEGISAAEIRAQYELDWNEWPVADGAPFNDVDSNGVYDPSVDIPGVSGADQTVWFVTNDLNPTNVANLYGAQPLGIECQFTIWAYSQQGALGSMIFKNYLIINKSNQTFDSMYVCQWADPDLGNAEDDLAGCDTTLSLGYIYNSNNVDASYNELPPPSAGFDFFQGPRVASPGDTTFFRGHRIGGYKSLPMTAFFYFIKQDPFLADPTLKDPAGSVQMYNFMRGRIGLTGQLFEDPDGNPSTFTLTGDPQAGTGWVDGRQFGAGDRRIGLSSGPFAMAPGDTQEVVVAEIAAGAIPGVDRLSAVGLLKFFDRVAQQSYNNNFELPSPPPPPKTTASELDREIVLDWGKNTGQVAATENWDVRGFKFQGYNVYQLPSASATVEDAKRITTYDVAGDGITRIQSPVFDPVSGVVMNKVVQFGTDSGLKHFITITGDALNGGNPLINGIKYYFAVTAYSYSPDPNAVPNNLETPLSILTVVPHGPGPGQRYEGVGGDTIQAITHEGPSDGSVIPIIVDPSKLTGHTYSVMFSSPGESVTWKLVDNTTRDTLLRNQDNQTDDQSYVVVHGMQVKVTGPVPGMKSWSIPSGTRRFSPVGGFPGLGLEGFSTTADPEAYDPENGTIGMAGNFAFGGIGTTLQASDYRNVLLKIARVDATLWDPNATPADTNYSRAYRYLRAAGSPAAKPEFAPWIVNPGTGYPYQGYDYSVPFSAWDMETTPPTRLAVGCFENNVEEGTVDGRYWPNDTNGDNSVAREFAFIFKSPYTGDNPDPALQVNLSNNSSTPLMWVMTVARRNDPPWSETTADEFLIQANHINTPADVFTWTAPGVTNDPALAQADISMINAFPNPYYGVNTEELNKYQRFITFSHLPAEADIKIFNLAGVMVRRIQKSSTSVFERWDLNNDSGLPVGSGLYIVHITMPGVGGATKILKVAIVQEQQILDRY